MNDLMDISNIIKVPVERLVTVIEKLQDAKLISVEDKDEVKYV